MLYASLIDQDITVYAEDGNKYRGILRSSADDGVLKFEVGIDTFYINARFLYAVTVHGISPST